LNEIELIQALQEGDKNAFSFLVQTYQHMLFNTVLSIVQQHEEAEDVAQEVFVQAFISIAKFRGDSKISTWLYRIAITKALDHQRKKKSKKRFGLLKNVFGIGLQEEQVAMQNVKIQNQYGFQEQNLMNFEILLNILFQKFHPILFLS
jgi:RNA polymerase sigma-70 factor (ECF subfamily)